MLDRRVRNLTSDIKVLCFAMSESEELKQQHAWDLEGFEQAGIDFENGTHTNNPYAGEPKLSRLPIYIVGQPAHHWDHGYHRFRLEHVPLKIG
jgi:hypothetical protein